MERELAKLIVKVKPHIEAGKSHSEACDAIVKELYVSTVLSIMIVVRSVSISVQTFLIPVCRPCDAIPVCVPTAYRKRASPKRGAEIKKPPCQKIG